MPDNMVKIILSVVKQGSGDKEMQASLGKLTSALKTFATSAIALKVATEAFDQLKKAVNETVEYNKTIREMSQVTGLAADETSRIIQVSDDWGISIDEVRLALGMMNKNGVEPSIDNLADLADEYVNTKDKTEFAAKAAKLLGRNYQTLIPLLAQGGDALREQADAVSDGLIATEASIAASRDYEVAMDNLNDTVQALKYEIGRGLIPELVDLLGKINDLTSGAMEEEHAWDRLKAAEEAGLITKGELIKKYLELSSGVKDAVEIENELIGVEAALRDDRKESIQAWKDATEAAGEFTDETQNAAMAIVDLTEAAMGKVMIDALNKAFEEGTLDEQTYRWEMTQIMGEMLNMEANAIAANLELMTLNQALADGSIDALAYSDAVKSLYDRLSLLDGMSVSAEVLLTYTSFGAPGGDAGAGGYTPRQHGGPVSAGQPYLVGEAGPELFVPNRGGTIIPNNTNNYNLTINEAGSRGNVMQDFRILKSLAGA